jgi:hypothetical protein
MADLISPLRDPPEESEVDRQRRILISDMKTGSRPDLLLVTFSTIESLNSGWDPSTVAVCGPYVAVRIEGRGLFGDTVDDSEQLLAHMSDDGCWHDYRRRVWYCVHIGPPSNATLDALAASPDNGPPSDAAIAELKAAHGLGREHLDCK